jgi:hypothetical protein
MSTIINATEVSSGGGGGGAPVGAGYLVTAAHADLTAEVAVGASPGGELGGTWASPTVDATHSGSSHAGVQAAAEATAAAALSAHEADTTSVHGIADTSALYRAGGTDVAVADGGTGASTAAAARTNLGLAIGSDVQAHAANLAAIAALVTAADRLPYFTGSGAATLADLTAFARTLLDDADAAAMRSTLGLVIGANVQAHDTELAAIAGLVSAANKLPYFTGSGAAALADLTTFARALLDDADSAAARTTLGLGTIATQGAGAVAITGGNVSGITDLAIADGGTGASTAAAARANLGFQHKRVSAGSIAAATAVDVTVTWDSAFADTNYTISVNAHLGAAQAWLIRTQIRTINAGSVVVRVYNEDTSARTPTLHAIAIHD